MGGANLVSVYSVFIRNGSSNKFPLSSGEKEPKGCGYIEIYFKESTPVIVKTG